MARCWAVVVAAGRGRRLKMPINKVYCRVAGQSILTRSLAAVSACPLIEGIVLVISEEDEAAFRALSAREGALENVRAIVRGGQTRQQSVYQGLRAVPEDVELVAIHDAARAMVPEAVVRTAIETAARCGTGIAASVVTDTIKRVDSEDRVRETLDRGSLRAVQTPQVFRRDLIVDAHERALRDGFEATDDAALVEHYVGPVQLVVTEAGLENRKLTTRADLRMFERMMGMETRVGQGFDAHRLVEGRALILCGVAVPHDRGLDGHSDADVATHALMDALLGAAGLGDIGRHFPDTDAAYRGARSVELLGRVMAMLGDQGCRVVNADVTIIAQAPRLAPYIDPMRLVLAQAMGVDPARVNVKATTTERMGYEGRGEGISASAVVLITKTGGED